MKSEQRQNEQKRVRRQDRKGDTIRTGRKRMRNKESQRHQDERDRI